MKKTLLVLTSLLLMGITASANFNPDMAQAEQTRAEHESDIMAIEGVSGVGVAYCDQNGNFATVPSTNNVPCIFVMVTDAEAEARVEGIYGQKPADLDGSMLTYYIVGDIVPHPGGTIGAGIF